MKTLDIFRKEINRQSLKAAAGRQIFCKGCGKVLDCRDTVEISTWASMVPVESGKKCMGVNVVCGDCFDKRKPAINKIIEATKGVTFEILDGRKEFGKKRRTNVNKGKVNITREHIQNHKNGFRKMIAVNKNWLSNGAWIIRRDLVKKPEKFTATWAKNIGADFRELPDSAVENLKLTGGTPAEIHTANGDRRQVGAVTIQERFFRMFQDSKFTFTWTQDMEKRLTVRHEGEIVGAVMGLRVTD